MKIIINHINQCSSIYLTVAEPGLVAPMASFCDLEDLFQLDVHLMLSLDKPVVGWIT
jgi:hypothetical protein